MPRPEYVDSLHVCPTGTVTDRFRVIWDGSAHRWLLCDLTAPPSVSLAPIAFCPLCGERLLPQEPPVAVEATPAEWRQISHALWIAILHLTDAGWPITDPTMIYLHKLSGRIPYFPDDILDRHPK